MTGRRRQTLKSLVDQAVREHVATLNIPTCQECGAEYDAKTIGCKLCSDRWNRRERYANA